MQSGCEPGPRRKMYFPVPGTGGKAVSDSGLSCWIPHLFAYQPLSCGGGLWSPHMRPKCWSGIKRLLDISLAKMGLFRMSRELYNGEPHASLHMAREGGCFYGEEEELGRATVSRVRGFSLAESLPGKKRKPFLVGFCFCPRAWELPFWFLSSI